MDALKANGKTKQVRKPNYTHEEITVLLEEVATNKMIIQSTLNSEVTSQQKAIVQELCESRGGRPGLSVLTSLLVSVDVKLY